MTTGPGHDTGQGMRRWTLTVGGFAVACVVVGSLLLATRWSEIPTTVATHWGTDGVNGTQSRSAFTLTSVLFILGLTAFFGLLAWLLPGDGRRVLAGTAGAMSAFLAVLTYGTTLAQVGLTDPRQAVVPAWVVMAAVALAVVCAAALWLLNPPPPPVLRAPGAALSGNAHTIDVAPGERLAWMGRAAVSGWVMGVVGIVIAAATVVSWITGGWIALIPLGAGALVLLMLSARVVINDNGVRVTSAGIPWLQVHLAEIREASESSVTPLGDFGGFGMRYGRDKRGFVTRKGEALLLDQADGSRTYVTIDHAQQAAAVVNTLLQRLPRS